jgi:hypothetical protein
VPPRVARERVDATLTARAPFTGHAPRPALRRWPGHPSACPPLERSLSARQTSPPGPFGRPVARGHRGRPRGPQGCCAGGGRALTRRTAHQSSRMAEPICPPRPSDADSTHGADPRVWEGARRSCGATGPPELGRSTLATQISKWWTGGKRGLLGNGLGMASWRSAFGGAFKPAATPQQRDGTPWATASARPHKGGLSSRAPTRAVGRPGSPRVRPRPCGPQGPKHHQRLTDPADRLISPAYISTDLELA